MVVKAIADDTAINVFYGDVSGLNYKHIGLVDKQRSFISRPAVPGMQPRVMELHTDRGRETEASPQNGSPYRFKASIFAFLRVGMGTVEPRIILPCFHSCLVESAGQN